MTHEEEIVMLKAQLEASQNDYKKLLADSTKAAEETHDILKVLEDCQQALANAIHSATPSSAASLIAWKFAEDSARSVITKVRGQQKIS